MEKIKQEAPYPDALGSIVATYVSFELAKAMRSIGIVFPADIKMDIYCEFRGGVSIVNNSLDDEEDTDHHTMVIKQPYAGNNEFYYQRATHDMLRNMLMIYFGIEVNVTGDRHDQFEGLVYSYQVRDISKKAMICEAGGWVTCKWMNDIGRAWDTALFVGIELIKRKFEIIETH